jgi:hypothetical protein
MMDGRRRDRPALTRQTPAISGQRPHDPIVITVAAFEAISGTLSLGSVGFEREPTASGRSGSRRASSTSWAPLRDPGESYSDVILKLVELRPGGALTLC